MKKLITAGLVLSALFAASGKVHAAVNYPWCIMGDTRGFECVFSSREQCVQDGRNRGFGGQCIQNPAYKPGAPTVSGAAQAPPTASAPVKKRTLSQTARPSQAVNAARSTCTGLKPECFSDCGIQGNESMYCEKRCNFQWEQCMKTGWWEGALIHRPAERR
jgi:Protein of unknown function (DUF3551)